MLPTPTNQKVAGLLGLRRPSVTSRRPGISRMRKRRGCPATDDRGGLVHQLVVLKRRNHEQRKVHSARHVALENRVTHMPTPDRKTFALTFLQLASPHDGPPRVAGEHTPTGLNLVVEVHCSKELGDPTENNDLEPEPP